MSITPEQLAALEYIADEESDFWNDHLGSDRSETQEGVLVKIPRQAALRNLLSSYAAAAKRAEAAEGDTARLGWYLTSGEAIELASKFVFDEGPTWNIDRWRSEIDDARAQSAESKGEADGDRKAVS